MKLNVQRRIAGGLMKCGPKKVRFDPAQLEQIKEAITKQDIHDLYNRGAILIRDIQGRRKVQKRLRRRRGGSIRKKHKKGKTEYMHLMRKLRRYIAELKKHGTLSQENYLLLRKQMRASMFKSKAHMKEHMEKLR